MNRYLHKGMTPYQHAQCLNANTLRIGFAVAVDCGLFQGSTMHLKEVVNRLSTRIIYDSASCLCRLGCIRSLNSNSLVGLYSALCIHYAVFATISTKDDDHLT